MWDKLKKILAASNERAVIVEDGEPSYVILSVNEYLKLTQGQSAQVSGSEKAPAPDTSFQGAAGDGNLQDWNRNNNTGANAQNEPVHGPVGGGASSANTDNAPVDLSDISYDSNTNDLENSYSVREASAGINLEDLPV